MGFDDPFIIDNKCIILAVDRGDIVDQGIVLTGGGALLRNLDQRLNRETGLPIIIAEDPLSSVVLGSGAALDNIDILKEVKINW